MIALIPLPALLIALTLPPTETDRRLAAESVRNATPGESNPDEVAVLSSVATESHSARHGDPPRDA